MYKIVGADQKEYGPATSDQVREWIAQGRANGQTLATFDGSPWKPLATYPEFADALRTVIPPPVGPPLAAGAAPYPGAQANTAAVSGLILCIVGTCCSPLLIIGLVLCVVGLLQIQKSPQQYTTSTVIPIAGIAIGLLDMIFIGIAVASGALEHIVKSFPH